VCECSGCEACAVCHRRVLTRCRRCMPAASGRSRHTRFPRAHVWAASRASQG
jgi:hypothetical protein